MKLFNKDDEYEEAVIVRVNALDGDCFGITLSSGHTILLELGSKTEEPAFMALIRNGMFDKPQTDGKRLFWLNGPSFTLNDILTMIVQDTGRPKPKKRIERNRALKKCKKATSS